MGQGYKREWPSSAAKQDAEKIAERGGFGFEEAETLLGHPLRSFRADGC